MNFKFEFEREDDGRWIAEIHDLPGVMAYRTTRDEAEAVVEAPGLACGRGESTVNIEISLEAM